MYHNKHYYQVEVYQALLSIVLTHVQVMLNICTTVSSATRATTKGKKKSFKCFYFRGADLLQQFTAFKNITKSAACVHNTSEERKLRDCGLYNTRTFKLKDGTSEQRADLFSPGSVQQLGCVARFGDAHWYDSKTPYFTCFKHINQEQKTCLIRRPDPQVEDVSEHTVIEKFPAHVSRLWSVPSSAARA